MTVTSEEAVDIMRELCLAMHSATEAVLDQKPNLTARERVALNLSATIKYLAAEIVTTTNITGHDLGYHLCMAFSNIAEMANDMAKADQEAVRH